MKLALELLALLSVLELGLWLPLLWRGRIMLGSLLVVAEAAVTADIVIMEPRLWTAVVAIFGTYRVFNLLRVVKGRMQPDYLYRSTRLTSTILIALQLAALGIIWLCDVLGVTNYSRWTVLAAFQLCIGLVLLLSTQRHLRTTKTLGPSRAYADRDLPSLTVAIPARNETTDLQDCLTALVTSDYPKLEILVIDDRSQNQRTPEIIRQFAHDGVRFLAGKEADGNSWLAKNYAYEQLAEAASGDLLLFCGVDVRFDPSALRTLVSTLLDKQKTMLSVLPHNAKPHDRLTYLVQPARYAWELSLPRRLFNRPPVLSTCWLIKKSLLKSTGGFRAASRSITPESYFARTARVHDGYSFVRSNLVVSNKPFVEQRATTIRTRYPQLRRRPELVGLVSLAEISFLALPYVLAVAGIFQHRWYVVVLSGLASVTTLITYSLVIAVTYREFRTWTLLLIPLVGVYDVLLLNFSMWKYEFSAVVWKGRDASQTVMRALPPLPKIPG